MQSLGSKRLEKSSQIIYHMYLIFHLASINYYCSSLPAPPAAVKGWLWCTGGGPSQAWEQPKTSRRCRAAPWFSAGDGDGMGVSTGDPNHSWGFWGFWGLLVGLVVAIHPWDDEHLMIPVQWCSWDGWSPKIWDEGLAMWASRITQKWSCWSILTVSSKRSSIYSFASICIYPQNHLWISSEHSSRTGGLGHIHPNP
jgi:hypothetical protein